MTLLQSVASDAGRLSFLDGSIPCWRLLACVFFPPRLTSSPVPVCWPSTLLNSEGHLLTTSWNACVSTLPSRCVCVPHTELGLGAKPHSSHKHSGRAFLLSPQQLRLPFCDPQLKCLKAGRALPFIQTIRPHGKRDARL